MKKIFLLYILSLISIATIAQNVGIGINNPLYKLDVVGRMRIKTGTVGNTGTTSGIWLEDYRTLDKQVVFMGMVDSIRWGLWGQDGVQWGGLQYNSRTGALGLGIVPTSNALSIAGANPYLYMYSSSGQFGGGMNGTDTTLNIYSASGNTLCFPFPCSGTPAKDLIFNPPSTSLFFTRGNIGFFTNAPTTDFQVAGRVQIGSGSPATGYQLSVNGKVICSEARVQAIANWPDYVFADDYKLRTLESLEQFIRKEKHLPGIPAAAEVEANGIDLGNMNKQLVEQIEQLTLHVIDLKKANDQMSKRIQQLENKQ
ncbi:MAG: hypothetical protein ACOYKE_08800 [Ferruginibacter sp.]